MLKEKKPTICIECGAPTIEPRKNMCPRCYQADNLCRYLDDSCACCGYADKRALNRRKMVDAADFVTLCGNCCVVLGRRKITLEQLQCEILPPDDRRGPNRRDGGVRRRQPRRQEDERRWPERDEDTDRRNKERRFLH